MKTLGEFLQRLENDSLFEKKAQAFNNGDELMAFVESEGYDFTLEELTMPSSRGRSCRPRPRTRRRRPRTSAPPPRQGRRSRRFP